MNQDRAVFMQKSNEKLRSQVPLHTRLAQVKTLKMEVYIHIAMITTFMASYRQIMIIRQKQWLCALLQSAAVRLS